MDMKKERPQERWEKKQEIKRLNIKLFLSKKEDREILEFFEASEQTNIDTLKMLINYYKKNNV